MSKLNPFERAYEMACGYLAMGCRATRGDCPYNYPDNTPGDCDCGVSPNAKPACRAVTAEMWSKFLWDDAVATAEAAYSAAREATQSREDC